mmetsp:Transcript_12424/g.18217  ORF Transcript_12424/g.18217 Transcript_12424/m.18217 type:complete len:248 (-) Transcript_12424:68-811(-)
MDLGFGDANQLVGSATANALMKTAKAQEAALDSQLDDYDALLDDDDALDLLRERRLQQLKKRQSEDQKCLELGHGSYGELPGPDLAKSFFEVSKKSTNVVIHFGRPTNQYCDVVDKHLQEIVKTHLETRFAKINVEHVREGNQGVTYLVEKLGITVLPTLVLIKNRKAVHHIVGFDELGGTDRFSTNLMKFILSQHGVLTLSGSELDEYGDDEMQEEFLESQERGDGRKLHLQRVIKRGIHDGEGEE